MSTYLLLLVQNASLSTSEIQHRLHNAGVLASFDEISGELRKLGYLEFRPAYSKDRKWGKTAPVSALVEGRHEISIRGLLAELHLPETMGNILEVSGELRQLGFKRVLVRTRSTDWIAVWRKAPTESSVAAGR